MPTQLSQYSLTEEHDSKPISPSKYCIHANPLVALAIAYC